MRLVMTNLQPSSSLELTKRELDVLEETKKMGARPVAPSLAASLYSLFLEGYSCLEISKQGKGLSEGDILFLREKFSWDEKRRTYATDLQNQIQGKLVKAKLEAIEFLTNQMAAIHKSSREQTLKYLMTGNPEDMPVEIGKLGGYKNLIDVLQKLTGESNTQKVQTKTESTINVNVKSEGTNQISPELQDLLLKKLAKEE